MYKILNHLEFYPGVNYDAFFHYYRIVQKVSLVELRGQVLELTGFLEKEKEGVYS